MLYFYLYTFIWELTNLFWFQTELRKIIDYTYIYWFHLDNTFQCKEGAIEGQYYQLNYGYNQLLQ